MGQKVYEEPSMEILRLEQEDVICASQGNGGDNDIDAGGLFGN